MERYDKYKDSGVEWIGEVPEHWEVKKVNYCFSQIGSGTTPTAGNQDYYGNGTYNWLQTGDLNDGEIFETTKKITQLALADYSTLRFYPVGSLVIAMYGATIGKTGLLKIQTTTNQACCVLAKPKNVNHRFAFYWLNSIRNHIISLSYGGGQPNINQEQIRNLRIQLPLESEQTSIASYLDRKTAEIDQLIADKKRLITLYEEEKTALINQAVTKGINPEVKMKDSGIDWLGEVPQGWEVTKMKHLCAFILDGTHGSFSRVSEGYRLLSVRNIINNEFIFRDDDSKVSESDFYEISKRFLVQKDDVQLAIVGATLGKVAIVKDLPENFVTQRSVATLRTNMKCLPQYLFYFIRNSYFQSFLWLNAGFSAQPGVYLGTIQNASIPLPDLSTQIKIIEWISLEEKRLDSKIAKTQKLIDLLTEYRTALISEVVTGKIKVV